jgi:signal peptidase I
MQPTLMPGDRLRVDPRAYRTRPPAVGEIVVVVDPEEHARWIVKRVAAAGPGTWWRTARGLVDAGAKPPSGAVESVHLGPTELWVVGDDLERSRDSRRFGPVAFSAVVGRALRIYAPTNRRREL